MLRRTRCAFIKTRSSEVSSPLPVNRSAMRARPKRVGTQGFGRKYDELKNPYLVAPFVKDGHVAALQNIEFGGMYRDELHVDRSRHPRMNKMLTINTDGSLSEREFETTVPPLMVLFSDRASLHKSRLNQIVSSGLVDELKRTQDTWSAADAKEAPETPDRTLCNVLAYPYSVPTKVTPRKQRYDVLDPRYAAVQRREEEEAEAKRAKGQE
jgi:hypothetical protein